MKLFIFFYNLPYLNYLQFSIFYISKNYCHYLKMLKLIIRKKNLRFKVLKLVNQIGEVKITSLCHLT